VTVGNIGVRQRAISSGAFLREATRHGFNGHELDLAVRLDALEADPVITVVVGELARDRTRCEPNGESARCERGGSKASADLWRRRI